MRSLLILLMCAGIVRADSLDERAARDVLARVAESAGANGVTAPFREAKFLPLLKEPVLTEGTFQFLPPAYFRRTAAPPAGSEMVSDGRRLWIELPQTRTVEVYEFRKVPGLAAAMDAVAAAFGANGSRFRVAGESVPDGWRLTLRPLDSALRRSITTVGVGVARDFSVREILLEAPDGGRTAIRLGRGVETTLRPEDFRYEPPPGFTVVAPFGD